MSRPSRPLRVVLAVVFGGAALYASFRKVDGAALIAALTHAAPGLLIAGLASVFVTLSLVTWRWAVLLGLPTRAYWARLWNAVLIGQAVNIVFPLRFGEAARAVSTSSAIGSPVGRVVVPLGMERLCDMSAFALVVMLLVASGQLPPRFATVLPRTALVIVVVVVGIALAVVIARSVRHRSSDSWLSRQIEAVSAGARELKQGHRMPATILLTVVILVSSAATNFLVIRAFATVPVVAAVALLAVLQVGTAVVSVPGNVGVFQYLTVLTLTAWNVAPPVALAAALGLHVVSLGPKVLLGALAATRSGQWPRAV